MTSLAPLRNRRFLLVISGCCLLVLLLASGCSSTDDSSESSAKPTSTLTPSAIEQAAVSGGVDAVRLLVDSEGLYRVSAEQLLDLGFDLKTGSVTLTLAGEPVSFWLEVAERLEGLDETSGGQAAGIVFYGQARHSPYGDENVYWLSHQDDPETASEPPDLPAMAGRFVEANKGSTTNETITKFPTELLLEENQIYLSHTPQGTDHWLWQSVIAPDLLTMSFDLAGWAGGDVTLHVDLWGNTRHTVDPDHHVVLSVNDQVVGEALWDEKSWYSATAQIPADLLQVTDNKLVVEVPGDTGAPVDMIYLDRIMLAYDRELALDAGSGQQLTEQGLDGQAAPPLPTGFLRFRAPAGSPVQIEMVGFDASSLANPSSATALAESAVRLWDVTAATAPVQLSGFQLSNDLAPEGPLLLSFTDLSAEGMREYALAVTYALPSPKEIQPWAGGDLRANPDGADYIAIVAPEFQEALQPLVEHRQNQGMRVTVATIDQVYDTFSYGLLDPAAIRDYLRFAHSDAWPEPKPRFLLLVGDASYDYHGYLSDATPNYVPTYLLTTRFVGETSSDNWFVSLDEDDARPDMAVGRIPAQTPEQVETVVAKTLAYEAAAEADPWASRALFVADNSDPAAGDFPAIAETLVSEFLPSSYQVSRVYLGAGTSQQSSPAAAAGVEAPAGDEPAQSQAGGAPDEAIVDALREGVGLVTYVGHGSMNVWAQEKIFRIEDVSKLDNESALPFMMTMTCLVGYFHHPQATSMGEELLFRKDGGVVAALVPTSESLASNQQPLAEGVYRHLFDGAGTLGEAIMLAKRDLPQDGGSGIQDLVETFTLLGDPALVFQGPGPN